MSEFIVKSESSDGCVGCDRDTCIEVGCEHAVLARTGVRMEEVVRCRDCTHFRSNEGTSRLPLCLRPSPWLMAEEDRDGEGFCKWAERIKS